MLRIITGDRAWLVSHRGPSSAPDNHCRRAGVPTGHFRRKSAALHRLRLRPGAQLIQRNAWVVLRAIVEVEFDQGGHGIGHGMSASASSSRVPSSLASTVPQMSLATTCQPLGGDHQVAVPSGLIEAITHLVG